MYSWGHVKRDVNIDAFCSLIGQLFIDEKRKSMKSSTCKEIDVALLRWVRHMKSIKTLVTGSCYRDCYRFCCKSKANFQMLGLEEEFHASSE